MRTNTIPNSISSIYVSVVLLITLISVNEKAQGMSIQSETLKNTGRRSVDYDRKHALIHCITLGQACYGGYGKRSYSKIERDSLEESINRNLIESNKIQRGLLEKSIDQNLVESKIPSTNDELFSILPNEEFRERLDQHYTRIRKDIQRLNSSPLSSLVNRLIAIHNRPHHRIDSDFTNK
ncbi:uncharacterized protein LOC109859844 [Pseudomyrmex gracilis]|uniref:uncharacterized protein LOC109859844 n=1 Tax=Pseudomyrmex gracilis TaxID=219809 RepID=UPI000995ADC1|nr:uncharacterized protein LOC109859844 [Pseudomyrmex gracilis]